MVEKEVSQFLGGCGSWTGAGALQAFPGSRKTVGVEREASGVIRTSAGPPPPPAKRNDLKHVISTRKRNKAQQRNFLLSKLLINLIAEISTSALFATLWAQSGTHLILMLWPTENDCGGNVIAQSRCPACTSESFQRSIVNLKPPKSKARQTTP